MRTPLALLDGHLNAPKCELISTRALSAGAGLILGWLTATGTPSVLGSDTAYTPAMAHITQALENGQPQELIIELDATGTHRLAARERAARGLTQDDETIRQQLAERFQSTKAEVLDDLPTDGWSILADYSELPLTFLRVRNEAVFSALRGHPRVRAIHENRWHKPYLTQSLSLIGQPTAALQGHTGEGITVAVLDTGVDYTRPTFGNCSSPGQPPSCRVVAALDFAPEDFQRDADGHGTNVAGIVAAVAPGALIAALDVFDGSGAWDNDIIGAINWSISNASSHNIRAINLSLGGFASLSPCGNDVLATPIANARATGILVAAASGNEGLKNALSSPACVPAAVSVGAVYDSNLGPIGWQTCSDFSTRADRVTCFSNSASFLRMLAPGALINAAGLTLGGTSQAAPHVAGAAAVLARTHPDETVDQWVSRMTSTGIPVTDPGNDITTPRLDLAAAVGDSDGTNPSSIISAGLLENVTHNWQAINVIGETRPVIIAGPPTEQGKDPGVARVRNPGPGLFELRFQEWDYLDGPHAAGETIPYLMVESGRHTLMDGSVWEAGTFTLGGTGIWQNQGFTAPFPGKPQVFLTVQTSNGSQAVTVRARDISSTGFQAALYEQQTLMDGHLDETLGYLAIYSTNGSGRVNVGGTTTPYLLQRVVANHRSVPVVASRLRLQEERSSDQEIEHLNETIDVLALGNKLFFQVVSFNGSDTVAPRQSLRGFSTTAEWGMLHGIDHQWHYVPLAGQYADPVVVAKSASFDGADPGVIRLKDVGMGNSFQVRFQEWDYLDGSHPGEQVFYIVAEAGDQTLAGLALSAGKLEADTLTSDGNWPRVNFPARTAIPRAVFTAVETYSGADAVTTRIDHLSPEGFDLAMEEQESNSGGHAMETLGWIAIQRGSGQTSDGRGLDVGLDTIPSGHSWTPLELSGNGDYPTVVTDISSSNGLDPATLRHRTTSASVIELLLQEEKSADGETTHGAESVSIFRAD